MRAVLIEVAWCDIVASVWSSGMFPALGGGGFVLKQVNESRRFSIWRQWCSGNISAFQALALGLIPGWRSSKSNPW